MAALKALIAQLLATALLLALGRSGVLGGLGPMDLAGLQGVAAAGLAAWLRSARWWLPLHLFFAPAVLAASTLPVPVWVWPAGLGLLLLTFGTVFRSQVPLFLSNPQTVAALARWLPQSPPLQVLDVGSGTGSFVHALAKLRPEWEINGVEHAWLPWTLSRLRCAGLHRVDLRRGDFWHHDLHDEDLVYAFLSPVPMTRLWDKARREMTAGRWLVSNSFQVPDVRPDAVLEVGDRRGTRLYCYRIGGDRDGLPAAGE